MSAAFPVTIYHNPKCGTSRNTLAMIRAAGHEPKMIEYLNVGWTREGLESLFALMGVGAREVLREMGTSAAERGLTAEGVSEAMLIEAMVADPILVNRPIVVTPNGARLCRPAETVIELLD